MILSQAAAQESSRKAIVQSNQLLTYMHRHRTCLEGDLAMLTVLSFAAESPQVAYISGTCLSHWQQGLEELAPQVSPIHETALLHKTA